MPILARNVLAGIPHHITQRGDRREDVFFTKEDREKYLEWLGRYCHKWSVEILAYCLTTNYIHLILKPSTEEGLQRVLKPLHMRYAQRINKEKGWKGHLWQGRFFSSALDEAYTWSAVRYIERNPVRAGMVEKAEEYLWSSASTHCGLTTDSLLVKFSTLSMAIPEENGSEWLTMVETEQTVEVLQRNIEKGLPCGSDSFVAKLEKIAGTELRFRPQGRPIKG